ncbi:MAG: Hsp20/alpha crystallin family protein [Thermoplasmata archaeon]|nr:Hsp20/alpha crystallin family protein [Thermoplasmata archaeon]
MVFDEDKKRKKKEAEEFERIVREMERIIEDAFKTAFNMQPFLGGFSINMEREEEDFEEGYEEDEDIFEDDERIYITIQVPELEEDDIKVKLRRNMLEIKMGDEIREVVLPTKVKRKIKKTFRNGILDIELEKVREDIR